MAACALLGCSASAGGDASGDENGDANGDAAGGAAAARAAFAPCFDAFECADVPVPVDWSRPDGETIAVRILRAPALDPSARLGTVVINPGGPGQPMIDRLVAQYGLFRAAFGEAMQRFDVVAFDWRGVGRSAPVRCTPDDLVDRLRAADLGLAAGAASAPAVDALRAELTSGCAAEAPFAAELGTESAARDLDRIREAIGEERLDFLGYSYGGWLGATYASRFPERVRAMVLDSPNALAADLEGDVREVASARETGLGRFFAACAASPGCALHEADAAAVAARFDALVARARGAPLAAGARVLSATDLGFALADALRAADWTKLAAELASAEAGDASALLARADAASGRAADGRYDGTFFAHLAIACADQRFSTGETASALAPFADALARDFPRTAPLALAPWTLCAGWPFEADANRAPGAPRPPRPPIDARRAPPALIVSATYDAITAHADAERLAALLGNGSHLLDYEGDGHSVSLRSACVRSAVTAFLVDPTRPPAVASCPAE